MSGHQGFVLGVGFSPDGKRLYSASIEGAIQVWDPLLRMRLAVWPGCHRGPILALAVDAEGNIITGGLDGTAAVWSNSGALLYRLTGHGAGVHGVAVQGDLIATASADGRIGLWRRSSGELIRYLKGHEEAITTVAFVDDHTLLSGSRDRTVRRWPLGDSGVRGIYRGHDWWVTRVGPVAGGRFVSVSEDATLKLWDPANAEAIWTFAEAPGPIWGLGIHPVGDRVVVGYGGDAVLVDLDARSAQPLPKVAPVSARAMSFNADGTVLALGEDHGDVDLIGVSPLAPLGKLSGLGYPVLSGVARSDLLVKGRVSGEVTSVSAGGVVQHEGHDFFTYCCRYLGSGRFASGGFDKRVRLWQAGAVGQTAAADHGGLIFSLDLSPDEQRLMAAGWDRITVLGMPELDVRWRLAEAGVGNHLVATFLPDGRIAGVGEAPVLKVWSEGREVAEHRLPDAHSCVIEAVPGESRVAVGSAHGRASLVDVDTGKSQALHGEHEDWIRVMRVSPDGNRVLSISQNGSARLYDRAVNQVVGRFGYQPVAIGDFDEAGDLHWLDCLGVHHRMTA